VIYKMGSDISKAITVVGTRQQAVRGSSMSKPQTLEKPFLIKFDKFLIDAVEEERKVIGVANNKYRENGELKLPPRTTVIRTLVRDAVVARRASRGQESPNVTPAGSEGESEACEADSEACAPSHEAEAVS
jgi:hypothetical protein